MTSVSSAFSKRPKSWGYRGDPYFWDALGWEFSSRLAQSNQGASADVDYEPLLVETFRQLAADGDQRGDGIALAWLPLGGMSGGLISSKKWRDELLPALAERACSIPKTVDFNVGLPSCRAPLPFCGLGCLDGRAQQSEGVHLPRFGRCPIASRDRTEMDGAR